MKSRLKIRHLILVFALAALPFTATFALYYPDERHYTDGALMMLKHGDWLVPHTAVGTPRFQKPPLAYWLVAASYATFGIGVLTSRLPFLLASCGTLWLIFNFLPWSATTIEWLARKKIPAPGNVPPLAQKFILAWTALLVVGFALGEDVSLRYLLPATPLLAVLLADWLQGAESARLIFSARRILKIVLVALALAVAAAFFIDTQWPLPTVAFALICGLFLFGITVLGLSALCRKSFSAGEALGLAILLGWVIFFAAAEPMLLPDRAQQIAVALRQTQTDSSQAVLLIGDVKLASRVRVLLGKNWTVAQANKLNPAIVADYTRVLVSEKEAGEFVKDGWIVQTAAVGFGLPPGAELWAALKSRQLPEAVARHEQKIYLATRE